MRSGLRKCLSEGGAHVWVQEGFRKNKYEEFGYWMEYDPWWDGWYCREGCPWKGY